MCDQRHNIKKHIGDEDEEDLDFLRSAALKSLQNKKDPISSSLQYNNEIISHNFKTHNKLTIGQNSLYNANRIEQYIPTQNQISPNNNYSTHNEKYFAVNSQRPHYHHLIDGNNSIRTIKTNLENYGTHGIIENNLENYGTHGITVKKLNINKPYVPHCLPAGISHPAIHSSINTPGWLTESTTIGNSSHSRHGYHHNISYVNQVPAKTVPIHESISSSLTNVQLSPRSLAFVEQNNDILARRKGGNLSPINYNRSPRRSKSPDYRRAIESSIYKPHSPDYSLTSSPVYRQSSPNYSPDIYKMASPRRWSVSPHNYKKAISRSPPSQTNQLLRQRSPGFNRKRSISRSPHRYSSRSPPLSASTKQRTKSRSPTITNNPNVKHRSPPIVSSSVRRYSRSPIPVNERHGRKTSRSPKGNNSRHCSPYINRYPINKKRSPVNHNNNNNKRRSPNNAGGHTDATSDNRQNRAHSPIQSSINNSHVQYQNKQHFNRRKSISPSNQHQHIQRNRSRTPPPSSPLRKYPRRSRDGNVGGHIIEQEKNRNKRSPLKKKRRGFDTNGASRNRGNNVRCNMRRSQSPSAGLSNFNHYNRIKRSRSRNSEKPKRCDGKDNYDRKKFDRNGKDFKKKENNFEKYERDVDDKQHRNINKDDNYRNDIIKNNNKLMKKDDNNENLNIEITETNDIGNSDMTSLTPPLRNIDENLNNLENTNKNIKEKSNDSYEICNDNSDNKNNITDNDDEDDDDDGIDLFPSDDSESETEGRFKSSSNRNERKINVPTLSFAKLNASSVPDVIKDLQDVCSNKNLKSAIDNRFDRRRNDRFKKNSRHSRNDKRRYNDVRNRKKSRSRSVDKKNRDESNGKYDRRDIESDDKRKNVEKSMFKSTFQAIDNNEGNKVNSKIERGSSLGKFNSNENSKKRFKDFEDSLEIYSPQQHLKSYSLKSSLQTSTPSLINLDKYKSAKPDKIENITNIRSLTPIPKSSNNKDGSDITTNGKKSIHSRLGAMTNTFKSVNKSSSWSKTVSSLTPPLPSSSSDKVSIFLIF